MQRETSDIRVSRVAADGRTQTVVRGELGFSPPSGPRQTYPIPSVGDRFGKLTVSGHVLGSRGYLIQDRGVLVCCECGSPEYGTTPSRLQTGTSACCMFCGWRNSVATRKAYVGYRDVIPDDTLRDIHIQRINGIWRRCHEPKSGGYHSYGGRGITCWWYLQYGIGAVKKKDKAVWRKKMLEYLVTLDGWDRQGVELDRIDNNKGYEPGNLRFVTRYQNANNRRTISDLQSQISALTAENEELRARIRHLEQRAA